MDKDHGNIKMWKIFMFYLIPAILAVVVLGGCISSTEEKVDPSIQQIKLETKLYFSVDSLFPDSNVNVNYSLSLHNLILKDRYRIEIEFQSQSNQFIQGYSTESFATDSTASFLWIFPRRANDQVNQIIQAYLKINNAQFAKDTATYKK